ncbi:MAG: STAS domain-containing protein [Acidimicrobiales bacterium]|nr:STAS domain-containing protein [Acidimicrobiales bacterium]
MPADDLACEVLRVSSLVRSGVATVSVSGELDPFSAARLMEGVGEVLRPDVGQVDIDLAGVSFVDARGFDALIQAAGIVRRSGRRFAVSRPSRPVERIAELLQVGDLLISTE